MDMEYTVWNTGNLGCSMDCIIARFEDIELAKDYVDYLSSKGDNAAVYNSKLKCVYDPLNLVY